MSYRNTFLNATDPQAFTAIRSKVDGSSEYLSGMKAGQSVDNTLQAGADATLDNTPTLG